jgi:hypothetical protein
MALLLTNVDGFRAHVVLQSGTSAPGAPLAAGELMVRGGKMLFAPEPNKAATKKARAQESAFIWDVNTNAGYVLNEPLQGYAPVSSSRHYTNLTARATVISSAHPAAEIIGGHPCQITDVTVTASDGAATFFQVWRATDLKGLPLRIICPTNGMPMTLTLTKVQLETLPADLFVPPSGFTKYESTEALMAELGLRGMNLGRKPVYQIEDNGVIEGRDTHVPNHPN